MSTESLRGIVAQLRAGQERELGVGSSEILSRGGWKCHMATSPGRSSLGRAITGTAVTYHAGGRPPQGTQRYNLRRCFCTHNRQN
jgi:hypothetical protein